MLIVTKVKKCKFKMSISKITFLNLVVHSCVMDMGRYFYTRLSHSGVWGRNLQVFTKQMESRKLLHLEAGMIVLIEVKWSAQVKGITLIGFLFCRSQGVVGRPGYRFDSRTIKRGSRVSNLSASFVESSNHCIFDNIFLGSHLAFLWLRL